MEYQRGKTGAEYSVIEAAALSGPSYDKAAAFQQENFRGVHLIDSVLPRRTFSILTLFLHIV